MRGMAHISFAGGGVFLPARNPYDREMLVEHVADSVRSKGDLQVAVDGVSWAVLRDANSVTGFCAGCGYPLHLVCYSPANHEAYCVKCAFGTHAGTLEHLAD
jgi:hypothetical protein